MVGGGQNNNKDTNMLIKLDYSGRDSVLEVLNLFLLICS